MTKMIVVPTSDVLGRAVSVLNIGPVVQPEIVRFTICTLKLL